MKELIGKVVVGLNVSEGEHYLMFQHPDGSNTTYEAWGDCCSETWFADITGVQALLGSTVFETDDVAALWDADGFDSSIGSIYRKYGEHFSKFFSEDSLPLLCQLQTTHDTILSSESFEIEMMDIAKVFGLVYTPPQEASFVGEVNV